MHVPKAGLKLLEHPTWSRDGEHLPLTTPTGFLHIDLATRKPVLVKSVGDWPPTIDVRLTARR